MNSLTLKENGFAEFVPIKGLSFSSLPYDKSSVFVLVDCTLTGKPTSDILYIGKSKKPAKRVFGGYLAGYGGKTTRKINSMLLNGGYLEKIAISWMISENPKLAQKKLMENFKKEHGEYPSWNVSKKVPVIPQTKPKAVTKAVKTRPTHKKPINR
ncbi:MAG TPA: hypothetical protein VMW95_04815 [Desulfobacterales bacterium]|nr:hypothetical protein [Desulfobacterales bacterium]